MSNKENAGAITKTINKERLFMSFDALLMMKLRTGISQELIICPRNDNDIRNQHPLKPLDPSFQQDHQQSPQNRPKPKNRKYDELLDEGWIYYRWYYSDDTKVYDIEEVANRPSVRWLLYSTGLENPGEFFYSINVEDLVIDPTAGRPRIGPNTRLPFPHQIV